MGDFLTCENSNESFLESSCAAYYATQRAIRASRYFNNIFVFTWLSVFTALRLLSLSYISMSLSLF